MSLLTLERSSPSPHESENEDLMSTSSYDGFVARDHYALCLTPRPITSLGPGRRGDHMRIFSHLKKLVKLLRPADMLKLAVELENNMPRKATKYMVVIVTHGNQETEETIVLGTEQEQSDIRIGMVVPLWRDTEIKLDGDGGFSVHSGDLQHVFKPLSVQSMWTALQTLYKCTENARLNNYYVGGLSHTWMNYYSSRLTTDGAILNEWNLSEDIKSFRPDAAIYKSPTETEETKALEMFLSAKLRKIMLEQDLEETTSKQLRLLLEEEVGRELKDYREFLDRQMLLILGQMERPSKIYDYLYLGSEWNASNLSELKELGVKNILNITKEIDNFYPEEFKYLNIRLYDVPGSKLLKHWDKTFKFIKEAKLSGKKVLVHCKMGISRSAATVIAYTMKEYQMSLEEALENVKGKRSVVNPNEGFMQQLKDYEGILKARHNELWGKKAPSRLHPLQHSRKLFHSEPNLPDMSHESHLTCEPELSFFPEEDERLDKPPDPLVTIDKQENIRHYLASLPAVTTIDDDQGIAEFRYNSESGSGYSTPNLSPTEDGQFNLRVQKFMKQSRSASAGSPPRPAVEETDGKQMKSEGEVTCNVRIDEVQEKPIPELKLGEPEVQQPVPFTIKTIGVECVSLPGSLEPSSMSPNPSSNVSLCSQPPVLEEEGSGALFRLGSCEPDQVTTEHAQIPSVPYRVKQIEQLNSEAVSKTDARLTDARLTDARLTDASRSSSVHSQLSGTDSEVLELDPPSSPTKLTSTRHESLSPSPPSSRPTEHVRHSSVGVLPSNEQGDTSEDTILKGAVKARVQDIEEKKSLLRKQSLASDKSDLSSSPVLAARPASVAVDDLAKLSRDQVTRRESTPPAVMSVWTHYISKEDTPPLPVQDLKKKFEANNVGGVLRRSQSLRTVQPPRRVSKRTGTSSPEQIIRHSKN